MSTAGRLPPFLLFYNPEQIFCFRVRRRLQEFKEGHLSARQDGAGGEEFLNADFPVAGRAGRDGVGDYVNLVSSLHQVHGCLIGAHVGFDASDEDLFFPRGDQCLQELCIAAATEAVLDYRFHIGHQTGKFRDRRPDLELLR